MLSAALLASACKARHPPSNAQDSVAGSYIDKSLAPFVRKNTSSDDATAFDKACAVELFLPNSQQIASLKKRLGEEGAYTALDDANWYTHAARQILERHGTPLPLPRTENIRFEGQQTWTLAIQDLRDQSAYLLFHPKRGIKLVYAVDIDQEVVETFFAP